MNMESENKLNNSNSIRKKSKKRNKLNKSNQENHLTISTNSVEELEEEEEMIMDDCHPQVNNNSSMDKLEENVKNSLHINSKDVNYENCNERLIGNSGDYCTSCEKNLNDDENCDIFNYHYNNSHINTVDSTNCGNMSETLPLEIIKTNGEINKTPIINYKEYESELQMPEIIRLIQKDLSEPYSIYTYRYFIHNWPKLCFLAMHENVCVGAIVCKLDMHGPNIKRGYIAMLAVDKDYRKLKIGTNLVQKAIQAMVVDNADEVVLETEITNIPALKLYENLGFVRDKRLFHYYLNGVDALRLKLWFR